MIEGEIRRVGKVLRHRPVNDLSLRICKRARHRHLVNPADSRPVRLPTKIITAKTNGVSTGQLCKARFTRDDHTDSQWHNPRDSLPNVHVNTTPQNQTLPRLFNLRLLVIQYC